MAIYDYEGNPLSVGNIFVNVKDFGAKGNGSFNDSTAIQSAIDSIKDVGGIVFFPKGTYALGTGLIFYSNQTLVFENGATLLQGASINNLLMSYCASTVGGYEGTHDCYIYGATFDGGAYTTNNTLVGTIHAKNIVFENCTFKNAYGTWHDIEINSSYNVKLINCDFEGSRKTGANGEMIQIDAINNSDTWPWDSNRGLIDSTVSKYIDIVGCYFHDSTVVPAIGNHSGMGNNFIKIHDCVFDGLTSTRSAIYLQGTYNLDIYDNTFNECTTCIGSSGTTHYIHDNRFVNATTAISGTSSIAHNNIINGTYTA